MSSVLKALKKIESRKAETQLPIWPYRINNRESMSRYTNRASKRNKILGILIVVCVVALAGKLYFGARENPEDMAPGTDLSVKTALPTASEEKSKTERLRTETSMKANAKPAPSSSTVYSPPPPGATLNSSPIKAVKNNAIETPQTAPKNNAGLTLQALVWSEQPEDRFVVINGVILREGDLIDGAVVSRIEPDYVTVRSDGTTWRLEYGQ